MLETEETFLRVTNEEERRECSEAVGIDEATKVIEKQSLSQHPLPCLQIRMHHRKGTTVPEADCQLGKKIH
jgi:hypothetical protein